jgi:hypothetical protein
MSIPSAGNAIPPNIRPGGVSYSLNEASMLRTMQERNGNVPEVSTTVQIQASPDYLPKNTSGGILMTHEGARRQSRSGDPVFYLHHLLFKDSTAIYNFLKYDPTARISKEFAENEAITRNSFQNFICLGAQQTAFVAGRVSATKIQGVEYIKDYFGAYSSGDYIHAILPPLSLGGTRNPVIFVSRHRNARDVIVEYSECLRNDSFETPMSYETSLFEVDQTLNGVARVLTIGQALDDCVINGMKTMSFKERNAYCERWARPGNSITEIDVRFAQLQSTRVMLILDMQDVY